MDTPPTGPHTPDDGRTLAAPGPRWNTPWWLWILAPLLLVAVVVLQRPTPVAPGHLQDLRSGKVVEPPGMSPDIAISKVILAYHDRTFGGVDISQMMIQQLEPPVTGFGPAPKKTAQEKFRTALVLAKVGQEAGMERRLDDLLANIDPESPLHQDIETALSVAAGSPVDDKAMAAFTERHGWFARVFLDDGTAGVIDAAKTQGRSFMRTVMIGMGVFFLLLVAGIVAIVILTGLLLSGKLVAWPITRVTGPSSGGVWLETVAIFLAGFLGLKVVIELLALGVVKGVIPGLTLGHLVWMTLIGQWALVATLFWPRLRGMSRVQHRGEAGWHRGRGFLREMGAGLLAYLAMLPLYFLVAIVVTLLMFAYYSLLKKEPPQIENKVMDLAAGGTAEVVAVFLLATIWAPLVEETIFRGAMFRWLRPRAGLIITALLTAAVFAVLHAYLVPQLFLVGTLGFCFAIIREWRNSLIGCMTAHALHNALIFSFVASLAPVMEG